ncbi:MAG TPA: ElyC/SanA/YdcF family protein [Pilimelia sp.]|nr:ElyC/SanA/YdcF family protein [Pilimelia sp.]
MSGRITGSAASMSGLVALDGDRAALQRVAAAAGGFRFRSYIADISGTSGSGSVGGAGPDVVAVLGAPNDPTGMLSRMAIDRCATAVGMCRGSPAAGLVLSGGFGAHFNTSAEPHWKHCERWIARRFGAGRARIVGRVESRHTYEDVLLLRELAGLLQPRSVTVVTSDYHVARARFLLDVLLPAAAVRGVGHDGLSAGEYERFRQHEHEALARTVAAALLFGVDRLPAEPAPEYNGGRLVVRLPPR